MVIKNFTTPESTNRTQTHVVPLSSLIKLNTVSANTGNVKVVSINGDNVTIEVSGGSSVRQELQSGSYTPAVTKNVTSSRSSSSGSFASTITYNEDGYVGTLTKSGSMTSRQTGGSYTPAQSKTASSSRSIVVSWTDWVYKGGGWKVDYIWAANVADTSPISYNSGGYSGTLYFTGFTGNAGNASPPSGSGREGQTATTNRYQTANYSGTVWSQASDTRTYSYTQDYAGSVTKPAVDTRQYTQFYQYELVFNYEGNQAPVGVAIPPFRTEMGAERTLKGSEIFTDPDGDALTFQGFSGSPQTVSITKSGTDTFLVKALAVGAADVTIEATDARGERSSQIMKVNVMNRLPELSLNTDIADTVFEGTSLTIAGSVLDKDIGHIVNVKYQINDLPARAIMTEVSAGTAITFSKSLLFRDIRLWDGQTVLTGDLPEGVNHILTVWAEDDQGGKTPSQIESFTVTHNRSPNVKPIPDTSDVSGTVKAINLASYFTDPDGDVLSYEVSSSNKEIATVSVAGQTLNVATLRSGQTLIAITADDGKGRKVSGSFNFHVLNRKPTVKVFKEDGSEAYAGESLGDFVSAFDLKYSVDDLDQTDKLFVTERVNGQDVRVIKDVPRNEKQTFDLKNAWGHVKVGENEISIVVMDGAGGTETKTHKFRATGDEFRFSLKEPVVTSLAADRIVVNGHTDIAPGATFNVMACNNGLDPNPTWEDVTKHFNEGSVHYFQNKTKVANDWAVDIEFRVSQGTSTRLSAISGFGFAFE